MLSNLMDWLFASVAAAKNESGQAMVEYGLIIALIAVVVAVALSPLGTAIAAMFTSITAQL